MITSFLTPDGNETLYNHLTCEYIAKTEVKIFVIVIVSMVKLTKKYLKVSILKGLMREYD